MGKVMEISKQLQAADGTLVSYRPLNLLVMQSTCFCNIDCSYCYLPNRQISKRMTTETTDAVFSDLVTAPFVGTRFTVVWHAGEPLTAGISFYQHALKSSKRLAERNCKVSHSIQTNATLIDDEWCELFRDPDIRIGVSLDGPAFLHDKNRKNRLGAGTHARVMRGIEHLRRHGINFHVICVLTRDSLEYPDELFEFFSSAGIKRLCFNIDEIEGAHTGSTMEVPDAIDFFRKFLGQFYELSKDSGMEIREFDSLRRLIYSGQYHHVNNQCMPFSIISVATDGNFSSFSPELLSMSHSSYDHFIFGNIHKGSFVSMLDSPHFRRVHADIQAGTAKCQTNCEYFALCGGGAPSNKVFENGTFDSTQTLFCRFSKQAVIDVVLPKIEKELGIYEDLDQSSFFFE